MKIYSPGSIVFFLTILLLIGLTNCKKEEKAPEIPYVYVNFTIDPNSTQYLNLNAVNGWETVVGGYKGILIYRKSMTEFMAFERACPNDPLEEKAKLQVENSGITCACPVCGSKFILTDGTPYEGPSHFPLKQYSTVYDGAYLHVTN